MNKHILLVEDDTGTAFFLGENLAELGPQYRVEIVHSGEEAMQKFTSQPFDMVIADLRMPGMDGLNLLRWIRQMDPLVHLILMSAYDSKWAEARSRHLDIHRYMAKPFRVEDLISAVRQALEEG